MKKIITVIGARPQFIKAALINNIFKRSNEVEEVFIHTGQHFDYEMSRIFFEDMKIPVPKYNLNINSLSHGEMTGKMLMEIESVLLKEKPDFLNVYGDTNSTLAGALAASKLHIPIIHIEAGLRSYNMRMPEEINRIITDRLSKILFCPGKLAVDNLRKEGFDNYNIVIKNTGDVMYDALLYFKKFERKPDINIEKDFVLCTIHREDNTNNIKNLKSIISALMEISNKIQIVIPLHPRTRKYLLKLGNLNNKLKNSNVVVSNPLGYLEILYLIEHCKLVMTDSGGLQKEAYFMKKPCITLRNETEWMELVNNNYNFLAGNKKKNIIEIFNFVIGKDFVFDKIFYGRGNASRKITDFILTL